jgi:hypothetical protein
MKKQTFKDFLQDRFCELEPQILDDDLSDAFDDWEIDQDTMEEYAQTYGDQQFNLGKLS